jgi:hypothetical protein
MELDKLVDLAGQAIFNEEWIGAVEYVARATERRAAKRRRGLLKAHREVRRAGGEPGLHPELVDYFASLEEWHVRYRMVVDRLRLPLCTGAIPAAIKLVTGQLVEVPAYFWQGSGAIPAFNRREATVDHGHGVQYHGRVLVKLADAEEWLVNLNRPPAAATPEAMARDWFVAQAKGERRYSRDRYCAEMVQQHGISKRAARRIWESEAPAAWKKPGAPRRSKSKR